MAQINPEQEKVEQKPGLMEMLKGKMGQASQRLGQIRKDLDDKAAPMFDLKHIIPQFDQTFKKIFDKPSDADNYAHDLSPLAMLQDCKALIFLEVDKTALGVGSTLGIGCLMIRQENVVLKVQEKAKEENEYMNREKVIKGSGWSAPIAVRLEPVDLGFQIGIVKSQHVIAVRSLAFLENFFSADQVKIGTDGIKLEDARKCFSDENPKYLNEKGLAADLLTYSFTQGIFLGDILKNQNLLVDHRVNSNYYGQLYTSAQVLMADPLVILPQDNMEQWKDLVLTLRQAADKNSYKMA